MSAPEQTNLFQVVTRFFYMHGTHAASFPLEEMGGGNTGKQETEGDRQTDMAAQGQTEWESTPNEKEA